MFHKKFPCALCKEQDKLHVTRFCGKIKVLEAGERRKLLEENLDCRRCLGDHALDSVKCEVETNLCGGGRKGKDAGKFINITSLHAIK